MHLFTLAVFTFVGTLTVSRVWQHFGATALGSCVSHSENARIKIFRLSVFGVGSLVHRCRHDVLQYRLSD